MATTTLDRPANGSAPRGPRPRPAGATARAAARSRSRVLAGALVLVISALAAGVLYANAGDRHPVLAVARNVEAGQVIAAADLREVLAAPMDGVRTVPASQRSSVVGRTAAERLSPGSLLHPAQVATGPVVDPASAVVGALLRPGQYPLGLRPGDAVAAVVLAPSGAPVDQGVASVRAVLTAMGAASAAGLPVSLAVSPGDAAMVAAAGAAGRLAVVVVPR